MVRDSLGPGLLDQNVLYNDNHSHSTTPPQNCAVGSGTAEIVSYKEITICLVRQMPILYRAVNVP
jgi:hypothetical protein